MHQQSKCWKKWHEHRRQDALKRCIWSWWCVATVVHLNDAHPSQWCTGVRDSSTQGHKGNHYGQVDGFSFELLVFKHENKRLVLVSYIELNIISAKEYFVPKYKCPMLWTVYGVSHCHLQQLRRYPFFGTPYVSSSKKHHQQNASSETPRNN